MAFLGCGEVPGPEGRLGSTPSPEHPPQGWAMSSSSQASHVAMTTAASQLGRDGKSPSHHRLARTWLWIWHRQHPNPRRSTRCNSCCLRAGPRSSFLHSQGRAGQERALPCRCSIPIPNLLRICGVLASRASSRLPPRLPIFSGGTEWAVGSQIAHPAPPVAPDLGAAEAGASLGWCYPR